MDWIAVTQKWDRWWELVNAVMNLWVPQSAGSFLNRRGPVNFSRTLLYGISLELEQLFCVEL